jgi:hypothetical protein
MVRNFPLILVLIQAACAGDKPSRLYGSWSSDAAATDAYLKNHSLLSEYHKKALPMLFGRTVITFNFDGTGVAKTNAARIPKKDGGVLELEAREIKFKFEILGETASQIVIKSISDNPLFTDFPFSIIKLHDANTYSIMLSDGITDINGREFFKRVGKEPNKHGSGEKPSSSSSGG